MKKKHRNQVLRFFEREPEREFSFSELTHLAKAKKPQDKILLKKTLQKLIQDKEIKQGKRNAYKSARFLGEYIGKIDHVNPYTVYIVSKKNFENDIRMNARYLGDVLNGDTVKFSVYKNRRGQLKGRVSAIIQKSKREFVGIVTRKTKNMLSVKPLQNKIYIPQISIPVSKHALAAKLDDKVVVKLVEGNNESSFGKLLSILGKSGSHEAEINSIVSEFGLPYSFPEDIDAEVEKINPAIDSKEIKKRRDFRDITTFTIDPDDAKDFDDALSIQCINSEKEIWEVGIHIADVTHYISFNSPIDTEARQRGTSVYLVDRTIHMLPDRLSTLICSLRPHEEKLTFSAVFQMDKEGNILKEWFGRTIIYSNHRFTYREAQDVIDGKTLDFKNELCQLNELAKKLRHKRLAQGGINFETIEFKVKLNDKKEISEIVPREHFETNKLIEEFMLLANKKVANFITNPKDKAKSSETMVYRVHEPPNLEKIDSLIKFVRPFGYNLSYNNFQKSINQLIEDTKGQAERRVLETQAIRTMSKAYYSPDNQGHYGLGFQYYTHFTSPIRRYPDMMVHRLLTQYLAKKNTWQKNQIYDICEYCSEMERRAASCERASIKLKQVEFMQRYVGQTLEGLVIAVNERCVFVEIADTKCEGVIHVVDLKDDYYIFQSDKQQLIGRRKKRKIYISQKIMVLVNRIDLYKRVVYLKLIRTLE